LEININETKKIVEVWLTNAEKNDEIIKKSLKQIYEDYKKTKYLVVVYESGNNDLFSGTKSLLLQNRDTTPMN